MLGYLDMTLIKQTIEGATLCSCNVVSKNTIICDKPIITFKNKIYRLLREKKLFSKVQNIESDRQTQATEIANLKDAKETQATKLES